MSTLVVETAPSTNLAALERALAPFGARFVKPYPNIGALLQTQLALFDAPSGTPVGPMRAAFREIRYLELAGPQFSHYGITLRPLGHGALAEQSSLPAIMEMTGAARALERSSRGGAGAILLVVDSGVDGLIVPTSRQAGGWTDDPDRDPWTDLSGHGTMVAQLASACCPGAKVFSVKAQTSPTGGLLMESVLAAADYLIPIIQADPSQAWVMNNSWGVVGCEMDPYW